MTHPGDDNQTFGQEIVEGLTELRDAVRDREPLPERFTMRTVELDLDPIEFTAEEIKLLRTEFRASQAVFAHLIGVEPSTLQAWEQGRNRPPKWACRLLDLVKHNPDGLMKQLAHSVKSTGTPA